MTQENTSQNKYILVTGVAGFIGSKVADCLLKNGLNVIGIDNLDPYYDTKIKKHRIDKLADSNRFKFINIDISKYKELSEIFNDHSFTSIAHLAAKAGVRNSIEDPTSYATTNIIGTINILNLANAHNISSIVMASTSSLYSGMPAPYSEELKVDRPLSPYAASKLGAEAQAYVWHHLYGMNITILRYFTVYGPCGRPDMSPFKFIECARRGLRIPLYGDGTQSRDFTYIDDVAHGTVKALDLKGFNILNIGGGNRPSTINEMLRLIGENLRCTPDIHYLPSHRADMETTAADITKARALLSWKPTVNLAEGIRRTTLWHEENAAWLDSISI